MSSTPMNNLTSGHFIPSSLTPGVSGESKNAPYGPKAVDECGIESVKTEYNPREDNHAPNGMNDFAKTFTSGLSEPMKEESSLKPR